MTVIVGTPASSKQTAMTTCNDNLMISDLRMV
jgi:hypothetical protein